MSGAGRRPGETFNQYLDRVQLETRAIAAARGEDVSPPPNLPEARTQTSVPAMNAIVTAPSPRAASETAEDARAARRRGVAAAIARDEEPRGQFQPVSAALPTSTQAATGLPAQRLRILRSDVPASIPRETPMAAFMARVRQAAKGLSGQGVSPRCVEAAAEACVVLERKRGGFAWTGFNGLATVAGYCARQLQRAMRWLEGQGLIDVMNVPYREGDEWWRDANIYVPTMDAEPSPLPADTAGPDPVLPASTSRALGGGARLAALFGLVLRAGGLNTSPVRNYRGRPAPA